MCTNEQIYVRKGAEEMGNPQREQQIMDILKLQKYASVNDLARGLYTSPSSIRRDIRRLELQGLVSRSHGGVSLISAQPGSAPFSIRAHENKREKSAIVRKASKLIRQGSSIFIDSSTTSLNFANHLSAEMNIKVFTNNIQLAHLLASKQIPSYCIGGLVSRHNDVITTGQFALSMLEHIYVDMLFFTSAALSENGVITDNNEDETAIRKGMLLHAKEKVFLCPRDRFPLMATYKVTDIGALDYVVSDEALPQSFTSKYGEVSFIS